MPLRRSAFASFVLLIVLTSADRLHAADRAAAELLPSTTVVYAEVARPADLLSTLLDHPLKKLVVEHENYKQAIATPEYAKLLAAIDLVEKRLGLAWRPAIEKLTGGGVHVGVDLSTQGVVLLVRADDPALLEKARDTALSLAREEAARQGQPDPIGSLELSGQPAYKVGEACLAIVGPWLAISNKEALLRAVLANHAEADRKTLGSEKEFQDARASVQGNPTAWAFVRIGVLRAIGLGASVYTAKSDNPVGELLVGGILSTLGKTPYAMASLDVKSDGLRLAAWSPHDPSWVAPARQFYFGPDGKGTAPEPLAPKDTLFSFTAYRDLGALWSNANELFVEQITAQFDQADSGLTTFFSGRDFGREVLGGLRPELQFVARRQSFDTASPRLPDVKLPAFALVARLKDPAQFGPQMRVAFQSLIGFLNVVGAQAGQPPLDMSDERRGGGRIVATNYLLDTTNAKNRGLINHNFSPSLALAGDRLMICSTAELAAELVDLVEAQVANPTQSPTNARLALDGRVLGMMLADNKAQFVAQNMLAQGHDKQQAEREIGGLLELARWFHDASLNLSQDAGNLRLEAAVRIAAPQ